MHCCSYGHDRQSPRELVHAALVSWHGSRRPCAAAARANQGLNFHRLLSHSVRRNDSSQWRCEHIGRWLRTCGLVRSATPHTFWRKTVLALHVLIYLLSAIRPMNTAICLSINFIATPKAARVCSDNRLFIGYKILIGFWYSHVIVDGTISGVTASRQQTRPNFQERAGINPVWGPELCLDVYTALYHL